ncbi:unnamed protein product [marine sediment metagenome]|uniref:DinB-like domain-containing protein n=1 Tax=marine sediment metagenome TaxID=412755 RepID=X0TV98_9ZZZZ
MSDWQALAHFLYGRGFWYSDPLKEIEGLTEEQLYWVPDVNSFCILWHVGHIAHRERVHIGIFLQGLTGAIIPPQYDVFGTDWCTPEEVRRSVGPVEQVLSWVRDVREGSHEYIASLADEDLFRLVPTSEDELTVGHWLFITTAHTALHLGRIQLLRALVEGKHDRAC